MLVHNQVRCYLDIFCNLLLPSIYLVGHKKIRAQRNGCLSESVDLE